MMYDGRDEKAGRCSVVEAGVGTGGPGVAFPLLTAKNDGWLSSEGDS